MNEVMFEQQVMSLTAAAERALGKCGGISGSIYWKFENETLEKRRKRLEREA